jgi:nucleoside-diphosphate-sugar epimerase
MNFTIIGGGGFIGSYLAKYIKDLGHDVYIPSKELNNFNGYDLGVIFYCAGYTEDYLNNPVQTIQAHVTDFANLLNHAKYKSIVYLSSTRIYDGIASVSSLHENLQLSVSPLNKRHLFDISKLCGESLALSYDASRIKIARVSCVFNSEKDPKGFLPKLLSEIKKAAPGGIIKINSSSTNFRDYIHISDVAKGLMAIALSGKEQIYNVASGINISNKKLADLIYQFTNVSIHYTEPEKLVSNIAVNVTRMKDEFAWGPLELEFILSKIFLKDSL